jgi:hypothetical protein
VGGGAKIVKATVTTIPADATQWSTRSMAAAQGVSPETVRQIWKAHDLKPHQIRSFKISTDPAFAEKMRSGVP